MLALAHAPRTAACVYAAGMTASNLASITLLILWVRRARPRGRVARGVPAFITMVLLLLLLTLTPTPTPILSPTPKPKPNPNLSLPPTPTLTR